MADDVGDEGCALVVRRSLIDGREADPPSHGGSGGARCSSSGATSRTQACHDAGESCDSTFRGWRHDILCVLT
ncbi:MAG: hypothetical protein ACRDQ0_18250 [Pseudonocardia sp.]